MVSQKEPAVELHLILSTINSGESKFKARLCLKQSPPSEVKNIFDVKINFNINPLPPYQPALGPGSKQCAGAANQGGFEGCF